MTRWAQLAEIEEATTEPPRRLSGDEAYRRIRAYLESTMEQPVVRRPGQEPGDRR